MPKNTATISSSGIEIGNRATTASRKNICKAAAASTPCFHFPRTTWLPHGYHMTLIDIQYKEFTSIVTAIAVAPTQREHSIENSGHSRLQIVSSIATCAYGCKTKIVDLIPFEKEGFLQG